MKYNSWFYNHDISTVDPQDLDEDLYIHCNNAFCYIDEEPRPVRPGMLLVLTSGLCFFLVGVGLMTTSTKTPLDYDVAKYAIGVIMLVIALLAFLAVAYMCVRHFNKVREREKTLSEIITQNAFADEKLLELSIQIIQQQLRKNSKSINKCRFLPNMVHIISEEQESLNKKKNHFLSNCRQFIKTLS